MQIVIITKELKNHVILCIDSVCSVFLLSLPLSSLVAELLL